MSLKKIKRRIEQLKNTVKYYLTYVITLLIRKENPNWLIAERGNDARDNGYVFYKYLKSEHPEIPIKFAITNDSPDRSRIEDADVIEYGTFKHYYYYITSPVLLSTHNQGYSPDFRLFSRLSKKGLIHVCGKRILLDHCVRMGKAGFTKATKIDMMVCSIEREYQALLKYSGYDPNVLCNIGMPRFDNLYHAIGKKTKKQILFMPTWRLKYTYASQKEFLASEYFKACNEILYSEELNSFLQERGMKFIFYPHIEMQRFISLFKTPFSTMKVCDAKAAVVEDLLIESQLLITDYSSVFFDFAYMIKPVIYYHFDNDANTMAVQKRWFSFEKDGFGPICYSINEVISNLNSMDLFLPDEKYIVRINDIFGEKSADNCERVFKAICKLL